MTLENLFNIQETPVRDFHQFSIANNKISAKRTDKKWKLNWRDQDPRVLVSDLHHDSRKTKPGSVYTAISGYHLDGHQFITEAINRGAVALVVENLSKVPPSFKGAVLVVPDTRQALSILAERFFQKPGEQMTAIAITGTNGKTSSACLLEFFLNQSHMNCGVIGTIDSHFKEKIWSTKLTTPDPVTLQRRLKDFLRLGARSFIIEVSSHALSQNRIVQGFEVCLFTNLSRDHLDYHKNMENYFLNKAKLFSDKMTKKNKKSFAIINGDDPYGLRLKKLCHLRKVFLFGQNEKNDFIFKIREMNLESTEIHLSLPSGKKLIFISPLIGEHNAYNIVGSLACGCVLGLNLDKLIQKLPLFKGVSGRLQLHKSQEGIYSFIDYAHTPEALNQVLGFLSQHKNSDQKLITVFGCGGNRDTGKRHLMGQVAQKYSDHLIITSDNPRTESPDCIINDILKGIDSEKKSLEIESDRSLAIKKAVKKANSGDIILIAGKGHEDYQILNDGKITFRDDEKIIEAFNENKAN